MLSGEPSDEPKNRLEVLKEKPSRGDADGRTDSRVSGTVLSGRVSSDSEASYCGSGGARKAACSSGSSGTRSTDGAVSAVFAPLTDVFDVAGSSPAGARPAGSAVSAGGGVT